VNSDFWRNLSSDSCDATGARHEYVDWLNGHDIRPDVVQDWAVVFSELLHNACRASPAGSGITIEASVTDYLSLRVTNLTSGSVPDLRQQHASADQTSGRGLMIASALADRVHIQVTGTQVEVTCTGDLPPT
jgi:anti-sigma regulatory factor (Ser/Thr protein kinase)